MQTGQQRRFWPDCRVYTKALTVASNAGRARRQVLNKFGEVNLAEINSKGGFFMGIIKRFREQERGVFAGGPKFKSVCALQHMSPTPGCAWSVRHNRVHSPTKTRCYSAGLNPSQFPAASTAGAAVLQVAPGGGFWPLVQAKLEAIYAEGHVGFPRARMCGDA